MISLIKTYPGQKIYIVSDFKVMEKEILRTDYNHIHFKYTVRVYKEHDFHRMFYDEKEALEYLEELISDELLKIKDKLKNIPVNKDKLSTSKYRRYCNTGKSFLCGCSNIILHDEYFQTDGENPLCNRCYAKLQRETYRKQTEKLNMLHVLCPFCGEFTSLLFHYQGGNFYGGHDCDIVCKECGRDFYIELDVRQHVSALNE